MNAHYLLKQFNTELERRYSFISKHAGFHLAIHVVAQFL